MQDFVHLHLHTEYSLLDGANRIRELPARIHELGMKACAITDHGVMYGVLEFYKACQKEGVHPILGCEMYIAPGGRQDRSGAQKDAHLILLAETGEGLENLNRLVSLAFSEGFYRRPRIDRTLLAQHAKGLIGLSACLSGEIPRALLQGNREEAERLALEYQEILGSGQFFLELQSNGLPQQNQVNSLLIQIGRKLDIPLVATNDCHYMYPEDAGNQDVLLCLQTGRKRADEQRMRMGTNQLYIKSPEEMEKAFAAIPEALKNTVRIAERCQAGFSFGTLHLPRYTVPPNYKSPEAFMREKCLQGLEKRLSIHQAASREDYLERLDYELSIISKMGFTEYYLIVWDFIDFARRKGIVVGPGRGSGASSLAAYCLGITNIDPLRYHLIFERFLNQERVSMPDFDIDFCYERRQEVIDYVYEKYGSDRVSQVITFGTLAARAVVRDVARVLDYPLKETDRLAKMIPATLGMTLDKALESNEELKKIVEENEKVREIWTISKRLEGMPRHASTHAAGVIICGEPIVRFAPLARNEGVSVVQYTKKYIESIGLLKFDFLGLRTLTVLRDAADLIQQNYGISVDYDQLDLADPEVFRLIARGETQGVFQLESPGMISFIKELKPESLEDVIAGISLFRPGPMEQIPRYVAARHDPSKICYDHPLLEPILKVTYGCIVYQEQVMQIVRDLAGFSMGMSDIVRRAMAKKEPEELARYQNLFLYGGKDEKGTPVSGCIQKGVPEETGKKIFAEVLAFAGYAFNKPHAAAYAVVAYYTAWLKCYYPLELMAALLNSYLGNLKQAGVYLQVCRKQKLEILPVDINFSKQKFSTEKGRIRFALSAVKNVGQAAIQVLIEEREKNGLFKSPGDFWRRMQMRGINHKILESLIYAGALDSFGYSRRQLLSAMDPYLQILNQRRNRDWSNQISLFDALGDEEVRAEPTFLDCEEYSMKEKLEMELEYLGLYFSGHPLDAYKEQIIRAELPDSRCLCVFESELEEGFGQANEHGGGFPGAIGLSIPDGSPLKMIAFLQKKNVRLTRKNEWMGRLILEDEYGSFEAIVFPKTFARIGKDLEEGQVYLCRGRVQRREEDQAAVLLLEAVDLLVPDGEKQKLRAYEKIDSGTCRLVFFYPQDRPPQDLSKLLRLLQAFPGTTPTGVQIERLGKLEKLTPEYWVSLDGEGFQKFSDFWGPENLELREEQGKEE